MTSLFDEMDKYIEQHPVIGETLQVWNEVDPICQEIARTLALYQFLNSQAYVTLTDSTQTTHKTKVSE